MEKLQSLKGLYVRQKKEWTEILTNLEGKNKYVVSTPDGHEIYYAAEDKGSLLLRWFLKAFRPFNLSVITKENEVVIRVVRPFKFYFHQLNILNNEGESLGVLKRQFSILRRRYTLTDKSGKEIFHLLGPLLKPWTFVIVKDHIEVGTISKKWSGLMKEGFTDADNFKIVFPEEWNIESKALLLGAVFLIDFVHFEK
mgnify:CR=1 FL=1|jgi:uncharacterized protein YxjI